MLRVGLTGGAGSGKSMVASMLQQLGAFVSQSDEVGRAMMQPGEAVYEQIVEHFGPQIVLEDGTLDRPALARIAFQDGRVEELNRIVHPAVIAAQQEWMESIAVKAPRAVAVVESALLFETRHSVLAEADSATPWRTRFDRIVLVTAPEELRLERYLQRQSASEGAVVPSPMQREALERDARARFAAQKTDSEKAALSDFVLHNKGTIATLRNKVEQLYAGLLAESVDRCNEAM